MLGLLDLMTAGRDTGSPFGNPLTDRDYWGKVGATRQPGEDNSQVFFRGMLPQSMWPTQWRDPKYGYSANPDRSDQTGQGNQPDRGAVMSQKPNPRASMGLMQLGLGMLSPRPAVQQYRWWEGR